MELTRESVPDEIDEDFVGPEYFVTTTRSEAPIVGEFEFVSFGFIVPTISVAGISLNLLNIFILRNRVQFPESSYDYLFSLALADLLTLFFFFVNSFGRSFYRESPDWRRFEIFGYFPIGSMTSNASVLLTVMVTLERFIFMYRPFLARSYCSRSFARRIISTIWVVCILGNIPRFFVMSISQNGRLTFTKFGTSTSYRVLSWIYTILFSISSAICLIIFNSLLIHAIHKRRSTLQSKTLSTLIMQEEAYNDNVQFKSLSCNTLNTFGCRGSRTFSLDELKADKRADQRGVDLSHGMSKSIESMETRKKSCRQMTQGRRKTIAAINLRLQQKQKEDFGLTLTLIGVVVLFLIGELPSSFLSRNIVVPLLGEEVLSNDKYTTANIVATVLVVTQHSTNFIIYYVLNHKFCAAAKKHMWRLLAVIRDKCLA